MVRLLKYHDELKKNRYKNVYPTWLHLYKFLENVNWAQWDLYFPGKRCQGWGVGKFEAAQKDLGVNGSIY